MRTLWKLSVVFMALCLEMATATDAQKLKADCLTQLCNCTTQVDQFKTVEFRVLCIGDGTQELILDDEIFKDEVKPDRTRRIYVRMTNFSSLTVDNSFVSRWQAYTSCSFDIWNCPNTMFSSEAPPVAKHKAKYHAFAGIGVSASGINSFPPMIFRATTEVGLKLVRSQVTYLDIVSMGAKKVAYLNITNTTIAKIGCSEGKSINLANSLKYGDASILVQNSRIGIITKGGMAFSDYTPSTSTKNAKVKFIDTTIGLLENGAINIGQNVSVNITQSNIGLISLNSFTVNASRKIAIEKNVLMIQKPALRNITCNDDIQIFNNLILHDGMFKECFQNDTNNTTCEEFQESDFIDPSCGTNHLWKFKEKKLDLSENNTSTPSTFSVINDEASSVPSDENTTETNNFEVHKILNDENTTQTNNFEVQKIHNDKNIKSCQEFIFGSVYCGKSVPVGLLYITVGLCLSLLIIALSLTILVSRRLVAKEMLNKKKQAAACDDYDGLSSAYFAPMVTYPLSLRKSLVDESLQDVNYYQI